MEPFQNPVDRRSDERTDAFVQVEYQYSGGMGQGMTADLSPSGMFLEADDILGAGEELSMRIYAGRGRPIQAKGTVVRTVRGDGASRRGLGIKFSELTSRDSEALKRFLDELTGKVAPPAAAERHIPRSLPAAPPPVAKERSLLPVAGLVALVGMLAAAAWFFLS